MSTYEFVIVITLLVITLLLFAALAAAAFYVGFCIACGEEPKAVMKLEEIHNNKASKKKKPPDPERERQLKELNRIISGINSYNGKPPVAKKDGD